ncbi:unnamed protein product [Oikopleura dioica]|uniref:C2H2-type domain-containing protein n=1 Tax=Oikopleura dioica TaxID=34765 RepID=E4YAK2_OIKDI|nr:unnamed protein product [Oikopleura dioica]
MKDKVYVLVDLKRSRQSNRPVISLPKPLGPQISSEPSFSSLSQIPTSLPGHPLQHHPISMFHDAGTNPILTTSSFPPHSAVSMPQIPFPGGMGPPHLPFFNHSLPFPPFFPQPSFPMTMPPYASDVVPDPSINPGGLYSSTFFIFFFSSLQPQNELKCQICGREFARRTNLLLHYRTHTGEKPYSCDSCGRSFSQSGSLKAHKRIHTGEMPYQCSYCPKKFRLKGQKTRHERTHTGERPFVCDQCGAKFADTTNLQSHKRIHTGERPFVCEHCHKGFSQKQHLKTHLLTHTGELPHECKTCKKRFRQKGHLKQHERTHTGEKPFECQICGQRFTKSGNLNSHMRLHQWRCELCNLTFSDQASMRAHELQVHPSFDSSSHM